MMREAWIEVDLAAIRHNAALIAELVGAQTQVAAVVKANAYGHGLTQVATTLEQLSGVWGFAVACGEEAIELRESGITKPILVLGPPPSEGVVDLAARNITLGVGDAADIASAESQLASAGVAADVHLKVNTGMCRMGVEPEEVVVRVQQLRHGHLRLRGMYSHFATAEESDLSFAREQLTTFREAVRLAAADGLLRHIANSAALVKLPESRFELVRPGAMLYGFNSGIPADQMPEVKPALRLVARVAAVKRIRKGCYVGYGRAFRVRRPSTIALVPIGYGDGYSRAAGGRAEVLVCGRRAPVVGSVNMDTITVDVTDIGLQQPGDEVVLIGQQGADRITVEEHAQWTGTIVHEVATRLGMRLPRLYV